METNQSTSSKLKLDFKDAKYATGRRKTSIAKVWLKKGSGKFYVNGKTLDDYFTSSSHKMQILRPFEIINQSTDYWEELLKNYKYDMVFIFPSWKEIYTKDDNRIEEYEEAIKISPYIFKVYDESSILSVEVPNMSVKERVEFIINNIQ